LLPSIAIAFFITLIFIIALRPLAKSVGLMDMPGGRKQHVGEVPIVGGIAIFLGFAGGMATSPGENPFLLPGFVASGLIVAIGILDDKYSLPASIRFTTQIVAVLIMAFGANFIMTNIGDPFGFGVIELGPFALIVTVLITVSVINAFNMIDGIDGLAGTMALIALISVALVAGYNAQIAAIALTAAASILAFLMFNFPTSHNRTVRTFMGDAGSMLIGIFIVWITMRISQVPDAIASPVVCLWFVAMPIYDLFTRVVRRALNGHSPFRAGRDHFHNTLTRAGLGVRSVLGFLAGLQLIYALIGLTGHFAGASDVVMFTAWSFLGISQHWIIEKYAARYRLDLRRKRANRTAVT
jgi:UDP-GlcNAc:undecaprenyl-phosphate GlcNAc-1-phosphate transferase